MANNLSEGEREMNHETQPNFLIVMSDEHGPMWSSAYGHPFVQTPNMDRLASSGTTFDSAYCNAPLCVPSRLSFMTGNYVSNCEGWDNATPLPSDSLTWPYALRSVGYDCTLSGKMHLIGPDKLHGFNQQLSLDPHGDPIDDNAGSKLVGLSSGGMHPIYLWDDGVPTAGQPWDSVKEAGPGKTPMIDADDLIEKKALAYLRSSERKDTPWALCVGFVAPHFPFIVPDEYFSMYYPDHADMPENPPGHLDNLPASARRSRRAFNFDGYTDEEIRRARAAYYGLVTYMDDKIGRLIDTLEDQNLLENTVIIYTSDHGESLGEHGLWRKMNFYEQSVRVPLQISWPKVLPKNKRYSGAVSLVDVTATIMDLARVPDEIVSLMKLDGDTLLHPLNGADWAERDFAFSEHLAHGTDRPAAMIRQGDYKLCYSYASEPELELYNLKSDPGEYNDLSQNSSFKTVVGELTALLLAIWNHPNEMDSKIRESQQTRLLIRKVLGDKAIF